jgi:serine protease Do
MMSICPLTTRQGGRIMEMKTKRSKAILAVAGVAVIFMLGMGAERIIGLAGRPATGDTLFPAALAQPGEGRDIPSVVERAVPAVVNIQTKRIERVAQQVPPMFRDPMFRQFFGDEFMRRFNVPQERVSRSLGSGVIVSDDGYILTNNHLVGEAADVLVILPDEREFAARVVWSDARTEVALLKIEVKDLPTIRLGDSSTLRLGETVIAIGYPFGVGQTVTQGIVSALGRTFKDVERRGVFVDFIQTDAAINPGNSGGALINTRGELIGINTAIYSNTGSYAGLGFAIPINLAREVMNDIIAHGRVIRGYLGVNMDDLTAEKAEFFGLKKGEGVILTEIVEGSPADKAGLKVDDVVTAINGETVKNMNDLRRIVAAIKPGQKAKIDFVRDGKAMAATANVESRPEERERASASEEESAAIKPELALLNGLGLEELNRSYRARLEIPAEVQGIIITEVDPNSPAADRGLRQGDVIVAVNRMPTRNIREFNARLKGLKENKILLTIWRDGSRVHVVLKD